MLPSVGQVLSVIAPLALVTVSQTTSIDYCQALADVISICEEATPSFTLLSASDQASCFCSTSLGTLAWGPATFEGLASDCASQYATIDATLASDGSVLGGFCTEYAGGVQSGSATQTSQTGLNTASASVLSSLTSGPSSTAASLSHTATRSAATMSAATTSAAATTSVSVVTIAATASSTSSNNNGVRDEPKGVSYMVHALIMQALALVAFV